MTLLTDRSLEFAKRHIQKYYDSDFFPKPLEFAAIWHGWKKVKEYLTSSEISSPPISRPRVFAAPKADGTFRIVHQLDPIDAIVYTALAYEVADQVEKARFPVEAEVACSYRIRVANGDFFGAGNGYQIFLKRCKTLAGRYPHVLVADITDFYNQTYLHRLNNNICLAEKSLAGVAQDIEQLLTTMNMAVSKGVPVGPAASIIMAEASLLDVDQYLANQDFEHTRYVDDIRIFADSKTELRVLLQRLTEYLYENHRLTLASQKTDILDSPLFRKRYLYSPEVEEKSRIHKALSEITLDIDPYGCSADQKIEKLQAETQHKVRVDVLKELTERIIRFKTLDLGVARHVLRKSKALRVRAVVPQLLSNFELFSPVINDLFLYFDRVTNQSFIDRTMDQIARICQSSESMKIPWVKLWTGWYLARHETFQRHSDIKGFLFSACPISTQALAAVKSRNVSWCREQKSKISQYGNWDRRAIIYSSRLLPLDERRPWLNVLAKNNDNFMDRLVIEWAKSF